MDSAVRPTFSVYKHLLLFKILIFLFQGGSTEDMKDPKYLEEFDEDELDLYKPVLVTFC